MSSSNKLVEVVVGGAPFGPDNFPNFPTGLNTEEQVIEMLDAMAKHKIMRIDTAQLYGRSEEYIGRVRAGDRGFIVDTKFASFMGNDLLSAENIIKGGKASFEKLKVKQIDIFYIHAPDPDANMPEALTAINDLHKSGIFARFGLSNFSAEGVREVYDFCKQHSYVLPSVYQGNYNALSRTYEKILFPTLRELGMAFFAYSPIAGGFLAKSRQQIEEKSGRFDSSHMLGNMYVGMYGKPQLLDALDTWGKIADEEGCSRADLAFRWLRYNSILKGEYGDAMVTGPNGVEQLEKTCAALEKGPVSDKAVKAIDALWEEIKEVAPLDNITWMREEQTAAVRGNAGK